MHTSTDREPDLTLRYAKHPARVKTSDGSTFGKAAIVVRDGVARFAITEAGKPVEKLQLHGVVAVTRNPNRTVTIEAVDGQTWTVSQGEGCACGSKLRSWWNEQQR